MAQYKVPQNVDIEDKVIAGLTLRQFGYLMFAGGGVLVSRYILVGPLKFFFYPVAICLGGFGIALAFLKINDRPFEQFLFSAGKTFSRPAKRVWQKEVTEPIKDEPVAKVEQAAPREDYKTVKNRLEQLAMVVDTGGHVPGHEKRVSNFPVVHTDDPDDLHDVLDKTEKSSDGLEKILTDAVEKVGKKKKEPPVSSLASMEVDENQYRYDKLPLKSEEEVNNLVDKANQKINPEDGDV